MTGAIPVEIVRPNHSARKSLGMLLGVIVALVVRAWLLMLLTPIVWHPVSYGYALTLIVVVDMILGDRSTYRFWTREARS